MRCRQVVGQSVAGRGGGAAIHEVIQERGAQQVDAHLELRQIHPLPAAGAPPGSEGRQHSHRGVQPGLMVVVGETHADVFSARHTRQLRDAGQRVNRRRIGDEAGPWAVAPHAGHLHINDAGIRGTRRVVAHAPAVEHAGREVVYHHVSRLAQPPANGPPRVRSHIQRQ